MLAISVDNLDAAGQIVMELGIPFPVLYDTSRNVPRAYMVYNLLDDKLAAPATFILDKDGVIRWKYVAQTIGDRASTDQIISPAGRVGHVSTAPRRAGVSRRSAAIGTAIPRFPPVSPAAPSQNP